MSGGKRRVMSTKPRKSSLCRLLGVWSKVEMLRVVLLCPNCAMVEVLWKTKRNEISSGKPP